MRDDPDRPHDEREPLRVGRRGWFRTMAGVSIGLGMTAASRYDELLAPRDPEEHVVPGVSTWYATSCRECPAGCGMIVRNRDGRVVKCEGNPDHPISRGRLCARGQAALQGPYDPDRVRQPLRRDRLGGVRPSTWAEALRTLGGVLAPLRGSGRVAVISELQSGSLAELIRRWLALFGSDRYLVHEPLSYGALRHTAPHAPVPVYRLDRADFILSFGADFLETWVSPVLYTRQFAEARARTDGARPAFVYVGPRLSMTAANADERLLLSPDGTWLLALALLGVVQRERLGSDDTVLSSLRLGPFELPSAEEAAKRLGVAPDTIRSLARRFAAARAPIALAGDPLSMSSAAQGTAAAASVLNRAFRHSPAREPSAVHALTEAAWVDEVATFALSLGAGDADVLVVIGANPGYSLAPGRSQFADALKRVKVTIALTPFADETADLADWVLPTHTSLECWGDYEPQTGVANLLQPTMGALYDTRMAGDALIDLARAAGAEASGLGGTFYAFLRERWREKHAAAATDVSFEVFWQEALQRGGLFTTPGRVPPAPDLAPAPRLPEVGVTGRMSVITYPSMSLFDGRGANKRWLQELPDPITKVAWASWVEVSPEDAQRLGIERGARLQLAGAAGQIIAPALVYEGLAPGTVAVPLGQGHTAYGRYAKGLGANAYLLGGEPGEVRLTVLGEKGLLPCSDGGTSQEGRGLALSAPLSCVAHAEREEIILPLPEGYTLERDMYPPHGYRQRRWAMVVDLNRCTGCGACVTACYAENNIGVVGPKRFARHHHMPWLRIDRYYDWTDPAAPVLFQPMLCQHCDAAPCEAVCPVYATAHNEEGLNMQVYNRCVGTRYCSNNCPYKVRRFNWFDYDWPEPLNWQANPDVTMRRRGVMEKCTFCIQRVREAEALAEREGRPLREGEVVPACVQTCPAGAFTFGDLMDRESRVARLVRDDPRAYQVLHELNTKPAVLYLKRLLGEADWT